MIHDACVIMACLHLESCILHLYILTKDEKCLLELVMVMMPIEWLMGEI